MYSAYMLKAMCQRLKWRNPEVTSRQYSPSATFGPNRAPWRISLLPPKLLPATLTPLTSSARNTTTLIAIRA